MEKGNTEGARIHAESAIRNKNQALNYLKLEARLNAVVSRLEEKQKMDMVGASAFDWCTSWITDSYSSLSFLGYGGYDVSNADVGKGAGGNGYHNDFKDNGHL